MAHEATNFADTVNGTEFEERQFPRLSWRRRGIISDAGRNRERVQAISASRQVEHDGSNTRYKRPLCWRSIAKRRNEEMGQTIQLSVCAARDGMRRPGDDGGRIQRACIVVFTTVDGLIESKRNLRPGSARLLSIVPKNAYDFPAPRRKVARQRAPFPLGSLQQRFLHPGYEFQAAVTGELFELFKAFMVIHHKTCIFF